MYRVFAFFLFISLCLSSKSQSATPVQKAILPEALAEISGMIHLNGKLYGIPDSGNPPVIYEFDSTTGSLTKTITLGGVNNRDWEDITHDGTYIYVGDFGNNSNGNRQDLAFLRFPITSVENITGTDGRIPDADIQTIRFAYEDQTDFAPQGNNNTQFDCEAVFYYDGYLHLFTKNWVTNTSTAHYRLKLPETAAEVTISAERLEDLDTQDILITAASLIDDQSVVLLGYNNSNIYGTSTSCAVWLITGFEGINSIFSSESKKQKIDLGLVGIVGQLESIAAVSTTRVLLASEQIVRQSIVIQQRLAGLNLSDFLPIILPYKLENLTVRLWDSEVMLTWNSNAPKVLYFEIEASGAFNGEFKKIGRIPATPSSTTYSFTDGNFLGNEKFYRIKVVATGGKEYRTEPVLVKKASSSLFDLVAIPSPFTSSINASFYSDTDQTIQLSIVDMGGRVLKTKQFQTSRGKYNFIMHDLQGLAKGMYFLTGRSKSGMSTCKILKQ